MLNPDPDMELSPRDSPRGATKERSGSSVWPRQQNNYATLGHEHRRGHIHADQPYSWEPAWLQGSRWKELLLFIAMDVVFIPIGESIPQNKQFVPEGSHDHQYPINLNGHLCTASDFVTCGLPAVNGTTAVFQTVTACCRELNANNGGPGETVPAWLLGVVVVLLPALALILRRVLAGSGNRYKLSSPPWDAFLGWAAAVSVCTIITLYIKALVGRPRPNYYSLMAYAKFSSNPLGGTASFKSEPIKSFPSGHSSLSMASMAYLTLLLWGDLQAFGAPSRLRRTALVYTSLLPSFLGLWVGVTRIRDYWHFQDDVLCGWLIGLASAAIGFYWTTQSPKLISNTPRLNIQNREDTGHFV